MKKVKNGYNPVSGFLLGSRLSLSAIPFPSHHLWILLHLLYPKLIKRRFCIKKEREEENRPHVVARYMSDLDGLISNYNLFL
jgi:hypothetical protein